MVVGRDQVWAPQLKMWPRSCPWALRKCDCLVEGGAWGCWAESGVDFFQFMAIFTVNPWENDGELHFFAHVHLPSFSGGWCLFGMAAGTFLLSPSRCRNLQHALQLLKQSVAIRTERYLYIYTYIYIIVLKKTTWKQQDAKKTRSPIYTARTK